jgi:hypothetical protein
VKVGFLDPHHCQEPEQTGEASLQDAVAESPWPVADLVEAVASSADFGGYPASYRLAFCHPVVLLLPYSWQDSSR